MLKSLCFLNVSRRALVRLTSDLWGRCRVDPSGSYITKNGSILWLCYTPRPERLNSTSLCVADTAVRPTTIPYCTPFANTLSSEKPPICVTLKTGPLQSQPFTCLHILLTLPHHSMVGLVGGGVENIKSAAFRMFVKILHPLYPEATWAAGIPHGGVNVP